MSDRHRAVYVAANAQQAHMLRNLLADAGINSFVSNDTLNGVHFSPGDWMVRAAGGPGFEPTAPKIVVHEDHAEQARQILLAAEVTLDSGEASPELTRLVAEADADAHWPACPHCGRPRLATCPICKSSGTDFAEAFLPESDDIATDEQQHLVLCPTCDEAFAPRYPARCEWCGHRFRDGYEAPEPKPLLSPPQLPADMNGRVGLLLLGMAVVLAALFGWFSFLVER